MSNPGANGFTLENGELVDNRDVRAFLMEAVSYGDLVEAPHTSKTKGERRTKYYLMPILSPYFRIPSIHTKEPEYVTIKQVRNWLGEQVASQALGFQPDSVGHVSADDSSSQKGFWDEDVA
jgi:hypothetical protein